MAPDCRSFCEAHADQAQCWPCVSALESHAHLLYIASPRPYHLTAPFLLLLLLLCPGCSRSGLYMCIALLLVASRIILPIIWAEGLRAVFFPRLAPKPLDSIKKVESMRTLKAAVNDAVGNGKAHGA